MNYKWIYSTSEERRLPRRYQDFYVHLELLIEAEFCQMTVITIGIQRLFNIG